MVHIQGDPFLCYQMNWQWLTTILHPRLSQLSRSSWIQKKFFCYLALVFVPWKRVQAGSYLLQWCVLYLYGSVWCWEGTKGYAWSTQFPSWSLGLRFKSSELQCTEKNGWGLAIWSPSGSSSWLLWLSISLSYDNSWIELVISPNNIQQAWRRNHHRSCNALQKRQKSTHKIGKKLHSQHTTPQWF